MIIMHASSGLYKTNRIKIPDSLSGSRADQVLSEVLTDLSRAQVSRYLKSGKILIDGVVAKPSKILSGGETVTLDITEEPRSGEPEPENIPLDILYEDNHIVVIDKPAGMVVHPGSGVDTGTLVNALLYHYPDIKGTGDPGRPGIVHRLDRETSGVMAVARNEKARIYLTGQFKKRRVGKEYLAIVCGAPKEDQGIFTSAIGRHVVNRLKMSSKTNSPRKAVTRWRVIDRFGTYTLVSVMPETGRTHQIRVHFSEAGYPVLADKIYGGKRSSESVNGYKMGRHALHAHSLRFLHPHEKRPVEFVSELPEDMSDVLELLRRKGV